MNNQQFKFSFDESGALMLAKRQLEFGQLMLYEPRGQTAMCTPVFIVSVDFRFDDWIPNWSSINAKYPVMRY